MNLKAILICSQVLFFVSTLNGQNVSQKKSIDRSAIWQNISPFFESPEQYAGQYGNYRSPLKFYDGRVVKTPADWKKRRNEILTTWNNMMGNWPPLLKDQQMKILDSTERDGFTQFRVRFFWTPNEETEGYLLLPHGDGKRPAVITVFYEPETAVGWGKPGNLNRDFAYDLAKRGFVTLSLGTAAASKANTFSLYYPDIDHASVEPLSMLGCAAANAWYVLAKIPQVDSTRIGIMGHSFGGKWAMFASCLFDKFACTVWSDPGIVFDETEEAINYWEPWYLGYYPKPWRKRGMITPDNPSKGLYPKLVKEGFDLHELHALMAPRPFLVSGGSGDMPKRWIPLNHTIAVNRLLGYENRVAMTNRPMHSPTPESNEYAYQFLEYFLKDSASLKTKK